jgi:beta-aspartyl-peptidase (threonine type)
MVIHGGAGTILKENMSEEKEAEIKQSMARALQKGYKVIKKGKSSEEAIIKAIMHLEDDPNFNAGHGAVLNEQGRVEMDASIMNGLDLKAGAIAGVQKIRNPILAAQAVKDKSKHVLLSGNGAEVFAEEQGLDFEDPEYFKTEKQTDKWKRAKSKSKSSGYLDPLAEMKKFGTVGAVALDKEGNISAGTSTGGMLMKKYGRIGDSPLIGSGTYADNSTCGVSCTGHGEYFIRYAVAYDLSALMKYKGVGIQEAADEIVQNKLKRAGGLGGLIVLDKDGNYALSFNNPGMYRGVVFEDGTMMIEFYK